MPLVTSASPHWERLAWQLHPWGRVHPRQACRRRSTLFDLLHEKPPGRGGLRSAISPGSEARIAERSAGHDARFGGYLMWGVKRQHYPLGTTRTELPRRRWRDRRLISDHGGTEQFIAGTFPSMPSDSAPLLAGQVHAPRPCRAPQRRSRLSHVCMNCPRVGALSIRATKRACATGWF